MLSNVRGEYTPGFQNARVHTPRPEMKLPPVGNFPPPSATKENKKRRGGPGSQLTGGAAANDPTAGPSGPSNRIGARGNASKVSHFISFPFYIKVTFANSTLSSAISCLDATMDQFHVGLYFLTCTSCTDSESLFHDLR